MPLLPTLLALIWAASSPSGSAATLFACASDADCVAVPQAGGCRTGLRAAVNRHQISTYYRLTPRQRRCTLIVVDDHRRARCNLQAHRCTLYAPPGGRL